MAGSLGDWAFLALSAYWTTRARLDYLDANHFVRQSAALTQICGGLMSADVAAIKGA